MPIERFVRTQLVPTPWKNGGGVTREIACRPSGSGMDRFDWRVSIAEISANGGFSAFGGVDRVIMLLEGNGVQLRSTDGRIDHSLSESLAPFAFSGDDTISAALVGGTSSDFNVMTRRATTRADVQVLKAKGGLGESRSGVLLAMRGAWHAQPVGDAAGSAVDRLEPGDGLWWDDEPLVWSLATTDRDAALIAVRIMAREP